jgi:hypothetical protein
MESVSVAEAKEHLDDLLQRAARGEDVRIADPSFGEVKLQRMAATSNPDHVLPKRVPGSLKGILAAPPDDFFDPMTEDELKDWYGEVP